MAAGGVLHIRAFDVPIHISSHRSVSQLCIYTGRMDTWAPHGLWNLHEDLWALSVNTVTCSCSLYPWPQPAHPAF